MSVFTAYFYSNRGEVSSLARLNFIFRGISCVVFLVNRSGGVFLQRVSGSARFFPAVHTMCKFGSFIKVS